MGPALERGQPQEDPKRKLIIPEPGTPEWNEPMQVMFDDGLKFREFVRLAFIDFNGRGLNFGGHPGILTNVTVNPDLLSRIPEEIRGSMRPVLPEDIEEASKQTWSLSDTKKLDDMFASVGMELPKEDLKK